MSRNDEYQSAHDLGFDGYYINYTREELFDMIERIRNRCIAYRETEIKEALRLKGIKYNNKTK